MRVIVTGSSGLLGQHVAAALGAAGHAVLGLDNVAPPGGAAWDHATVDLTDLGATLQLVRDADAVIHGAAIPRPTGRAGGEVFHTNVAATYGVVEAAVLGRIPRIVYASSFSVLGFPFFTSPVAPRYLPLDETHPPAPQDAYGLSKWLGEEIVEAGVRRGGGGLTAVSLRMPWIQTPESFARDVIPRRADPAGGARDLWAYLDARDAADAFLRAVEGPVAGHLRLFLSAADSYSTRPTTDLLSENYPAVPLRRAMPGTASVFDLAAAARTLGFVPRRSWRDYGLAAARETLR